MKWRISQNNVSLTVAVVLPSGGTNREELGEGNGFVLHPARQDAVPLPWIEESPDALGGAKRFSTLDLASGYNQVHVAEKEKAKCIRHPIWIL